MYFERMKGVEPSSRPWEGHIMAVILHSHLDNVSTYHLVELLHLLSFMSARQKGTVTLFSSFS